jgi:hypothetical protein
MPAAATLSINDGQTTPVAHSFTPAGQTGSKVEWNEKTAGIPGGYFVLSHELIKPGTPDAAYRIKIGLNVPATATVDGSLAVVRNSSAQVVFNFSQSSTLQERKDLVAYVTNTLGNADFKTSTQNIEQFW